MFYELLINLQNSNEVSDKQPKLTKVYSLHLINVTDDNISIIGDIPTNIEKLCIEGNLKKYEIPDSILDFDGSQLGLEELTLNNKLEWLNCWGNALESINLNEKIIVANLDDNKLQKITARGKLNDIQCLSICKNRIKDFDLLLPSNTMVSFDIEGNEGIRIKYLDFIFRCDENDNVTGIIDGDYKHVLGDGILDYDSFVRNQVAQWCYTGRKYIDINSLRS